MSNLKENETEDLKKQMNFILELDKAKHIFRQTYLTGDLRRENDAEHSWHLAVMTLLLAGYSPEPIDVLRTVAMVLIHDVVEIDAGDTYAYDAEGNKDKRKREERAADRLFGLLPAAQGAYFRELWEEFEARQTPEARFANSMDKIQPILLTDASGGASWRDHGVREEQIRRRNADTGLGAPAPWRYAENLISKNIKAGNIKPQEKDT